MDAGDVDSWESDGLVPSDPGVVRTFGWCGDLFGVSTQPTWPSTGGLSLYFVLCGFYKGMVRAFNKAESTQQNFYSIKIKVMYSHFLCTGSHDLSRQLSREMSTGSHETLVWVRRLICYTTIATHILHWVRQVCWRNCGYVHLIIPHNIWLIRSPNNNILYLAFYLYGNCEKLYNSLVVCT